MKMIVTILQAFWWYIAKVKVNYFKRVWLFYRVYRWFFVKQWYCYSNVPMKYFVHLLKTENVKMSKISRWEIDYILGEIIRFREAGLFKMADILRKRLENVGFFNNISFDVKGKCNVAKKENISISFTKFKEAIVERSFMFYNGRYVELNEFITL